MMRVEIASPQEQILGEIGLKSFTRDDVALTYAFCIRQNHEVDFATVNAAILERWSPSALEYIKAKAFKLLGVRA